MQIHVVQKGDSLWKLSQFYEVPWQEIAAVNGLKKEDVLAVGQTILILTPLSYRVQQGDTLAKIAGKLGVTVEQLRQANPGLTDSALYVGRVIRVPEREKRTLVTNAFAEPSPLSIQNFENAAKALSYISLFSYEVNRKGELKLLNDTAFLKDIKRTSVKPLVSITNIENGKFSQELASAILNNEDLSNRVISNTVKIMKEKDYSGVNVDFEFIGGENREAYNRFLRKITERMHRENFIVSTALAPKQSATQKGIWYEGHDYKAHGEIVDYVILMTYEWGYSGGPPMAVSPIDEIKKVIDYAVTEIPRDKILMGINLYGYDWTLPYVAGGPYAKALSPMQATRLATRRKAAIQYRKEDESPFYHYWDKSKKEHIVWFEDLRSMEAKFNLIDEYRLAGASFWNLAFNYPVLWIYLDQRYTIRFHE
ncbi:glycosyl hydrolase family 18 protein [Fictibacillus gelatini]|uniref:glycosyl hydrolase family 18 protein n=1 Tax=Fictibacillus gelatini TaxID=225985 RepID=UPI00041282A0|nr:LysM peptidoglycan-binding domain-containing protein [Fictibacillus gelatini]